MIIRIYIYLVLIFFCFEPAYSQSATDIYLLDLSVSDARIEVENPRNITQRTGYDNQPSFSSTSKQIFFTSIRADQQADIYQYDIVTQKTTQLTSTPQTSEYSPIVMNGGKHFSVVRVEIDGKTQRLWRFSFKNAKAKLLMPMIKPVGYYTWYKPNHVAMFILGQPHTLKYTHVKKQNLQGFTFELGRSLHTIPGTEFVSFVDKTLEGQWMIKSWNSQTNETEMITQTLSDVEDYCWTPNGFILMGKNEHLFVFNPKDKAQGWKEIGNLGIGDFYRLSCSPDGKFLAAVVYIK